MDGIGHRFGHRNCIACGDRNPRSLRLSFIADDADGVRALVPARAEWQGYPGILHGGLIATVLDAAMTHCLFHHDIAAVTADLRVRYVGPVPADALLEVSARILSGNLRLHRLRAEIAVEGAIAAWAEGKFIPV